MSEPCRMVSRTLHPGIDEVSMAIFYALRRPGIKLEALTTTFGNTDTAIATENTLRVLELLGPPGHPGRHKASARSLDSPLTCARADHVHGTNGIGDVELPVAEDQG